MRSASFIHTIGLCALWCIGVLIYVGRAFVVYDTAVTELNDTRAKAALSGLRSYLQSETDKGSDLVRLNGIRDRLALFVKNDRDVESVFVFDTRTGKVLFGSQSARTGGAVPDAWRKKCDGAGSFFVEETRDENLFDGQKGKRAVGTPIYNAFNEKSGCIVAEYRNDSITKARNRMAETAFATTLKMLLVGAACLFLAIAAARYGNKIPLKPREQKLIAAVLAALLLSLVPIGAEKMKTAFETDMKPAIDAKAKIVLGLLREPTEKAIAAGVPLTEINGAEPFFDQIRKRNPEILFVLLTDKSGRVLRESGSAAEAFAADKMTGKVALREGYFSSADPVRLNDDAVGWIQIGINERFVRENLF